jgi:hypothetical protein
MFIVVGQPRAAEARRALEEMGRFLAPDGDLQAVDLGSVHLLAWMTRAGDTLAADQDPAGGRTTIFLGYSPERTGPAARRSDHPLATGVRIDRGSTLRITPIGVRNVYRDGLDISDSSLLLAAVGRRAVSPVHLGILASSTYLPGRLTLFPEIRRIQFHHQLTLTGDSWTESLLPWPEPASSDHDLVERITQALAADHPATVAVTGGYDSRFVLGVLRRAGRALTLVHKSGPEDEDDLVREIARAAGLPLTLVPEQGPEILEPLRHTAATDAGVYLIGNTLVSLEDAAPRGQEIHFGHICSVKNGYISAYNRTPPRADMVASTIDNVLLRGRGTLTAIDVDPAEARAVLEAELRDQLDLLPLRSNKAKGTLLYFLNRGLRWSDAHHGGLSLFNPTISPMSELSSSIWSFGTSMWDNLANDRVRRINHDHGFDLGLPYGDGGRATPYPALVRPVRKVRYEYLDRFLHHRSQARSGEAITTSWDEIVTDADRAAFERIGLRLSLDQLLEAANPRSLKRAAVTGAHAVRLAALEISPGRADA